MLVTHVMVSEKLMVSERPVSIMYSSCSAVKNCTQKHRERHRMSQLCRRRKAGVLGSKAIAASTRHATPNSTTIRIVCSSRAKRAGERQIKLAEHTAAIAETGQERVPNRTSVLRSHE